MVLVPPPKIGQWHPITPVPIHGITVVKTAEALFIKEPGIGAIVSWHQDGVTHWDSPDFDGNIPGFNFRAQLCGSTAVNGVWVLPGSHKLGKIDIKDLVSSSKSERIEGAGPLICDPGDVVIFDRQALHASFPNSGFEPRLTVNFGYHKRSSVLGAAGGGIHSDALVFDDEIIARLSRVLGYAIAARKQRFPAETAYEYKPFTEQLLSFAWDDAVRADIYDHNRDDLSI